MAADPLWQQFRDDVKSRVTDWGFAFGHLEQEREDSRGWRNGLCPIHGESNPSFGYNPTTGAYHCFSCGQKGDGFDFIAWRENGQRDFPTIMFEIAKQFGVEPPPELRENGKSGSTKKWLPDRFTTNELVRLRGYVTHYDYQDLDGATRFIAIRHVKWDGSKSFKIAIPDPEAAAGHWQSGLHKRETIPYRLPQVAEAIREGRIVFVTEGEKDVATVEGLGCVATCNPEGAGKWRKHFGPMLSGAAFVFILADNDEPGQKHAHQVAESLWGHVPAGAIRVVNLPGLPPKGDVTDFVEAGGTKEEIAKHALATPPWTPAYQEPGVAIPALTSTALDTRPRILVSDRQELDITDDAHAALARGDLMPLQYGDLLGMVRRWSNGVATFRPHNSETIRTMLTVAAVWTRRTENGEKAASPPVQIAQNLLHRKDLQYPYLRRIVTVPVMASDGTIDLTEGYQPQAQVYYAPAAGLQVPPIPDHPTQEQIQAAVALILDQWLGEFPYADSAGRAHVLATCLHPFVRALIDGPTPLVLSDANSPGTGKTLLVEAITTMVLGGPAGMMAEGGREEEEWRKRLTTATMSASPYLIMDNVKHRLESAALANYLTVSLWKDRMLGGNREIVLPVTACVIATGNNLRLSDEIARRSIQIHLDARVERPWERTGWRIPHLTQWTREHRGELVSAILTLCMAWVVAGQPKGTKSLGSYERWAAVVGGILDVAGVPGLLSNSDKLHELADEKMDAWRGLVSAWWDAFMFKRVMTSDLFGICKKDGLMGDVLGSGDDDSRIKKLGHALRSMRDRIIGGYRVTLAGKDRCKRPIYQLDPVMNLQEPALHLLSEIDTENNLQEPAEPAILQCSTAGSEGSAGSYNLTPREWDRCTRDHVSVIHDIGWREPAEGPEPAGQIEQPTLDSDATDSCFGDMW